MQPANEREARKPATTRPPPGGPPRPETRSRQAEVCLAHPSMLDAAYGCVDWYIYPDPKRPQ